MQMGKKIRITYAPLLRDEKDYQRWMRILEDTLSITSFLGLDEMDKNIFVKDSFLTERIKDKLNYKCGVDLNLNEEEGDIDVVDDRLDAHDICVSDNFNSTASTKRGSFTISIVTTRSNFETILCDGVFVSIITISESVSDGELKVGSTSYNR